VGWSCGKNERRLNTKTDCVSCSGRKKGNVEDHVKDGGTRLKMVLKITGIKRQAGNGQRPSGVEEGLRGGRGTRQRIVALGKMEQK